MSANDGKNRDFLFLLGSARTGGNTEHLARRAAEKLPPGADQRWLRLRDLPLPAFEDIRHRSDGVYPQPTGHAKTLLDATLETTDLVIASPLYWYSVSASVKLYLDYWAGWMRVPGLDFRSRMAGKTLWAITALSEEDPAKASPLVDTLRITADYLGMHWGGALLGYANRPGDIWRDGKALSKADSFFTSDYLRPN
ncbi:NAD(P)H-dependent oxidoreductase [Amycolatopsis cynarae]|uniref:NAD(P)H-dependent oxidoreductase n=1 Tax=Amycolatopsis cynarae TaxID=2995223 RepID=A0ABY7B0U8_9PSEU|nr:NAD(P)H-dependent oxidoreductase [Amycolatopsis sp. HUAS 11-8]WAL65585.1 NAD(P)H-dependent oxidoreductase [Amycolatopsis sp. HUAS 11-8]